MISLLASFCSTSFNPRTRRGCDTNCLSCAARLLLFQSTHPQGVRLLIAAGIDEAMLYVSIHAPAGGATICCCVLAIFQIRFNPRTRRGCDMAELEEAIKRGCFNPRTRRGCDWNNWG